MLLISVISLENSLLTGELADRAYSKEDRDLLKQIAKQEVGYNPGSLEVVSLGFQGMSNTKTDNRGMLVHRTVSGPGKPVLSIRVNYKDSAKKDATRIINVNPTMPLLNAAMATVGVLYSPSSSSKSDQFAVANMGDLYNQYAKSKVKK